MSPTYEKFDLLDVAREVARGMGDNPQSSLRAIKDLVTKNAAEADLGLIQKRELAALSEAYKSPEHKEAIAAFMEKWGLLAVRVSFAVMVTVRLNSSQSTSPLSL